MRYSLKQLIDIYYNTVGNGAVLLLNSNPNPNAVIPPDDVRRAKELSDTIRKLYESRISSFSGRCNIGNNFGLQTRH